MKFTDIFIRRPVLATVVSLLILIAGVRALGLLEVRQYPKLQETVVTVTTAYPGASSDLIKGFITTPLQQAMAEADGIDYLFSSSSQGVSTIEAHMKLNFDPNAAVAEIQAKVASKRSQLPADAQDPVIDSSTGSTTALMYVAVYSNEIPRPRLTDYVIRVVQPQLQALPGVAKARVFGAEFAMRIWLDPQRMAALNVTAKDVTDVLRNNNYLAAVGATKGKYVTINMVATTDVGSADDFQKLVVRDQNGTLVRLGDIAKIDLGADNYDTAAWYKGVPSVFMAIEQAPGANPLTVAEEVNDSVPKLRSQLPEGMQLVVPYDASRFIDDSIHEVYRTLIEAVVIVLLVVYLSLGSARAALVPAVTVPLSLIGGAFIMLVLGYSLNLLTLLSMVLAIGLVVDDAIIVVENIHRHIENGESRFNAAINGAREMAMPIIAMTTTLLAVYAPIGFTGGLVGTLFTEFAFTLTGAVIISGIVALTLSPVLSSKVLKAHGKEGRFEIWVEHAFNSLSNKYHRSLHVVLESIPAVLLLGVLLLASIYFMFVTSRAELAPAEDQSILFFQAVGPRTATLDYHEAYGRQIQSLFEKVPEYKESFFILGVTGPDTVFGGLKLSSFTERQRSEMQLLPVVQGMLQNVAGFQTAVFERPSLPVGGGGFPIDFVLTTDRSYEELAGYADQIVGKAMQSGRFLFLRKSVSIDQPVITVDVDRDRAGDLGIKMNDIGGNLGAMLGGGYTNRFNLEGRSYKVVPQVSRDFRLNADMLKDYYVRAGNGQLVPLSTVVSLKQSVEPSKRTQFQQLNALSLEGVMFPGVSQGQALDFLKQQADAILPKGYGYDYKGSSRQYVQQGSALLITFVLSMLVIYLVLAAQFESWRDPLIILVSVPLSVFGSMIFITLGLASVNIYTQVGLITLIGVVAKNGILIVEFSNQLQIKEGLSKREAVEKAAEIRLRPILMTTASLIVAMVPLLTAAGPGAVSRFDIGLTIATGLGIGTLFTLYVLPAFYLLLARDHAKAQRELEEKQA